MSLRYFFGACFNICLPGQKDRQKKTNGVPEGAPKACFLTRHGRRVREVEEDLGGNQAVPEVEDGSSGLATSFPSL